MKILRKLEALFLLVIIALIPIAIVLWKSRQGGIWVAGYVTGIVTVPFIAVGALRAIYEVTEEDNVLIAFVIFGGAVILISLAAAAYAFLR